MLASRRRTAERLELAGEVRIADTAIRSLYVDLLFLGVHGMDPEAGYTTPNLAEAETNRTLVANARRVVVLADSSKWRTIGLCRIAPLRAADVVVTDDELPLDARRVLGDATELIIVPVPSETEEAG